MIGLRNVKILIRYNYYINHSVGIIYIPIPIPIYYVPCTCTYCYESYIYVHIVLYKSICLLFNVIYKQIVNIYKCKLRCVIHRMMDCDSLKAQIYIDSFLITMFYILSSMC